MTAAALDAKDLLAPVKARFHLPQGLIYLDGNSLGAMPLTAPAAIEKTIRQEWSEDLITSWNKAGWFHLTDSLGDKIARLVGAESGEVVASDTTSINIFKTLAAALSLKSDRKVIVAEEASFPTDLYIAQGLQAFRPDLTLRLLGRDGKNWGDVLRNDVAAVLVNHVDYRTGELADMAAITKAAHEVGALTLWDLSHSAGVIPVALNACDADFAVGCGYKYLNGGPGAPAYLFVAKRHQEKASQPLSGWWGHAAPFAFTPDYEPGAGIRRFLCGTQPILSLRALEQGLKVFDDLDMKAVRAKSQSLTGFFIESVERDCAGFGLALASPRDAERRGSQVSFRHAQGYAMVQALIEKKVVGDFRAPDILRFGFSPLYLSHSDVAEAARRFAAVLKSGLWQEPRFQVKKAVT